MYCDWDNFSARQDVYLRLAALCGYCNKMLAESISRHLLVNTVSISVKWGVILCNKKSLALCLSARFVLLHLGQTVLSPFSNFFLAQDSQSQAGLAYLDALFSAVNVCISGVANSSSDKSACSQDKMQREHRTLNSNNHQDERASHSVCAFYI